MRIIAGSARGRKLSTPRGMRTRPTLGRARESLFSILAPKMDRARFLDLFAGTGAIGIEALSRGAQLAVFVENDTRVTQKIRENLDALELRHRARIIRSSASTALRRLAEHGESFDVVFADPPYDSEGNRLVANALDDHPELVAQGGIVVMQQHHKESVAASKCFDVFRQHRVGDTRFVFYGHHQRITE